MHDKLVFPVFISESARHIEDFTQRFGFYGNTGNLFFQEAVYRQLKNIEYAPWRELQHSADSVKEKWDCIVLSQANVLSPTNEISEGFLTFLEKANMPIVQIGMGLQANSFFEQVKLKPSVLRFLDIIKERSVSIGVRGYHTAEYLANMGIHNVDVIGCPTLYWHRNPQFQLQHFAKKIQHVGTNFTCRGSFIKEIRNFLKWSMKYAEGFVEQDVIPMLRVIEGLEPQEDEKGYWQWICPEGLPMTELQDWFRKKGIAFYDMEKWISYISNHYDFVIGGRIHGCMAAIQGNVPALLLALDQRTQELAQFMNIPYMNIYDFDDSLPPQHYYDNLDYSLFNATYIHRWVKSFRHV